MKKIKKLLYCLPAMAMAASAHAKGVGLIQMWQSGIQYKYGQQRCIADFTFGSHIFSDPIKDLKVVLNAIDRNDKVIEKLSLKVDELNPYSEELVYATAEWDSENACNPDLHLKIVSAEGIVDGKKQDLFSDLFAQQFVPFKIVDYNDQQEESAASKDKSAAPPEDKAPPSKD